jgi:hypothetical protein
MKDSGKMISNMGMENSVGQMKQFTKDSIRRAKNMVKVFFFGKTIAHMRENFLKTISTDSVNMYGKTEGFMKESGRITRWKEKEFLPGLMAEDIKDSTKMTRRKGLGFSRLEMEEFMKESGRMENNMVKVFSGKKISLVKECGRTENVYNGLIRLNKIKLKVAKKSKIRNDLNYHYMIFVLVNKYKILFFTFIYIFNLPI